MRVTLLNNSFVLGRRDNLEETAPHIRLGIASLAAYLRQQGTPVALLDPHAESLGLAPATERILETAPDLVALPAYTEEIMHAAAIAERLKQRRPDLPVVVGGPHVSALPVETLTEFPQFDLGVVGEGELTLAEIAAGRPPAEIAGLVWRDREGVVRQTPPRELIASLDDLPDPAFDLYALERYPHYLPLEPLRGCPYGCVFCYRALGTRARYKSPERIVAEMERAIRDFDCRNFRFVAGTFPLGRAHAAQVFEALLQRGLRVTWSASARVDTLDDELLGLMERAGCVKLQIGVESGDEELLNLCGKGITPGAAEEVFRLCRRHGIQAGANFILGLPGETRESLRKTRRLALRLTQHACGSNFAILTPYPGTQVREMALRHEHGLRLKSEDWQDYGKQAGQALEHEAFPGRSLLRWQTGMYLSLFLRRPRRLLVALTRNSGRALLQAVRRLVK